MRFKKEKSSFKKVQKNRNVPKGLVHAFLQKLAIFLISGFWGNPARKHRFLIFWKEKNALWTTKVKFQKSPVKSKFSKGVSPWFLAKNGHFSHFWFVGKSSQE